MYIYYDEDIEIKFKNKDDIINYLLTIRNGDGCFYQKLLYPDGSYYEYEGEK